MKDKIREDENFFWERMNFLNYLTIRRVLLLEKNSELSSSPDGAENIEKLKELLQSLEQGYLNYKKSILSRFGKSGVETVMAIAFGPAIKKSEIVAGPTSTPSKDRAVVVDDESVDVCASLAKWEYEAGHLKRVKWTAYIVAVALVGGNIMPVIDLFGGAIDLLKKWIL